MNTLEFRPVSIKDVSEMSLLLMGRQIIESDVFPFLRNSCLNRSYVSKRLKEIFNENHVIGIGAFSEDQLVGYMFGEIIISTRVGRCAWIPYEGVAIGSDQSSELIRQLYAHVSVRWLEHGCFKHSVYVPVANPVYYNAFVHLSFAIEQVHAVMPIDAYQPFINLDDIQVRLATKKDRDVLGNMSSIISTYQNASPVFIPAYPEVLESIHEGFKNLVDEKDEIVLLAVKDGTVVGFHDYEVAEPSLMLPDHAIELSTAGIRDSFMGMGIGKILMNESHNLIKDKGFKHIVTDWRITNLASSTFWPKCAFKPNVFRMARQIDTDYAWAKIISKEFEGK